MDVNDKQNGRGGLRQRKKIQYGIESVDASKIPEDEIEERTQ